MRPFLYSPFPSTLPLYLFTPGPAHLTCMCSSITPRLDVGALQNTDFRQLPVLLARVGFHIDEGKSVMDVTRLHCLHLTTEKRVARSARHANHERDHSGGSMAHNDSRAGRAGGWNLKKLHR